MSQPKTSQPVQYFEELYASNPDPWNYTWAHIFDIKTLWKTRLYEQRKYWKTLRTLPAGRYQRALELGCSIGVFTKLLAPRCQQLLAVDCSPAGLQLAQQRCRGLAQVQFEQIILPDQFPAGQFDLIVFSETACYLSLSALDEAMQQVVSHLTPGGYVIMAHGRHYGKDLNLPLSGDQVHDWILQSMVPTQLTHVKDARSRSSYRMDLFQKPIEAVIP